MPKSALSASPTQQQQQQPLQKSPNAEKLDKISEVALRKKKNADAQAAFRARRANYIATLEETVTSLEAVVVQLQDSCREARNEAQVLRQENSRLSNALETLRHECREREKYLRALWQARKGSDESHLDDFPPPPPSFAVAAPVGAGTPTSSLSTPVTTPHAHSIAYSVSGEQLDPQLQYTADSSVPLPQNTYHTAPNSAYADRSPVTPFMTHDVEPIGSNGRGHNLNLAKMNQYAFNNMAGHVRDTGWHPSVSQAVTPGNESAVAAENGSATHSPAFMPSTVTSNEVPYGARYAGPLLDGHKNVLPGIEPVHYMMDNGNADRSISPTVSSPHTASSASVSSQFPFVFPTESQERTEADYHRRMGAGPELTLHGGTADISAYSMSRRRTYTGPERPMLGSAVPYHACGDGCMQVVGESSKSGSNGIATDLSLDGRTGIRRRRSTIHSAADYSSRSPSPTSHTPISSTLAVIKAQAFGALRRARTRPKKSSEGAAKMAIEALEARGIGLGINGSSKRQRLSEDDGFQS